MSRTVFRVIMYAVPGGNAAIGLGKHAQRSFHPLSIGAARALYKSSGDSELRLIQGVPTGTF